MPERGRCGVGGWWPRRLPSAARRVPCGARSWKASKELALAAPPSIFAFAKLGARTALLDAAARRNLPGPALLGCSSMGHQPPTPQRPGATPCTAERQPLTFSTVGAITPSIRGISREVHIARAGWALGGPSAQPRSAGAGRLRRLRRPAKLFELRGLVMAKM